MYLRFQKLNIYLDLSSLDSAISCTAFCNSWFDPVFELI